MYIRKKVLIVFAALLLLVLGVGSFIISRIYDASKVLKNDMPAAMQAVSDSTYLDSLAQVIHYYDEVLTQSARNYAFTGAVKWKTRYQETAPKLDADIKEAIAKGDEQDKQFFSTVDQANLALVGMEEDSIRLVDQGDQAGAQTILESTKYWDQKKAYQAGLDSYLAVRNAKSDEALKTSTAFLQGISDQVERVANTGLLVMVIIFFLTLALTLLLYWIISHSILLPLRLLKEAAAEISKGNLTQQVDVRSKDEIGETAKIFNAMARELRISRENIEDRVRQKTSQTEKLNQFMVGRELEMIKLKEELKKLKK